MLGDVTVVASEDSVWVAIVGSLADSSKLKISIKSLKLTENFELLSGSLAWWMPALLDRSAPEGREVTVDAAQGSANWTGRSMFITHYSHRV